MTRAHSSTNLCRRFTGVAAALLVAGCGNILDSKPQPTAGALPESTNGQSACKQAQGLVYEVANWSKWFCSDPQAQFTHGRVVAIACGGLAIAFQAAGGVACTIYGGANAVGCLTLPTLADHMKNQQQTCNEAVAAKNLRRSKAEMCGQMNTQSPDKLPSWCPNHKSGLRYCGDVQWRNGVPCYSFDNQRQTRVGNLKEFTAYPASDMRLNGTNIGRWRKTSYQGRTCFVEATSDIACSGN